MFDRDEWSRLCDLREAVRIDRRTDGTPAGLARLAFVRWLYQHGRLTEWVQVGSEPSTYLIVDRTGQLTELPSRFWLIHGWASQSAGESG